jgi:hypothetical protein
MTDTAPALSMGGAKSFALPNPIEERSSMATIMEPRAPGILPNPRNNPPSIAQPLSASVSPGPIARPNPSSPLDSAPSRRTQIPGTYLRLERTPVSAYDDNPVFTEFGAAMYLGLSAECMKKWRQRNQGPHYIQYGPAGPVRYELDILTAFRAAHRVKVGSNR